MTPPRAAILALVELSPNGISAKAISSQLGLTEHNTKGGLKWLRRDGQITATCGGPWALWITSDRHTGSAKSRPAKAKVQWLAGSGEPDSSPFVRILIPAATAKPLRPRGPRSVFEITA